MPSPDAARLRQIQPPHPRYFDVNLDIVWTTVTEDLPAILPALDSALAEIDG